MMLRNQLGLGVLVAATLVFGACPDDGDSRRPIGATCASDGDCQSGFCLVQQCVDPEGDADGDGLTNRIEAALGTDPFDADSDGDGMTDREELDDQLAHVDSDGDGVADALESATEDGDHDCLPDQLDAENDVSGGLQPELIAEVCQQAGVCGADGATLRVECPGDVSTAICVYSGVPDYEDPEVTCDERDNDCDGMTDEELDCTPEPVCGDGIVQELEACDDGDDNGATACGCQTDCQFASAEVVCREGSACDPAETCDGAGACPEDAALEDGASCTDCASEVCVCGGGVCVDACGNGTVEEDLGEACDDGAGDNGATVCGCQADCQFAATDVVCREGDGCDEPEMCDGAGACPEDAVLEDGASCTGCASESCVCGGGVCIDACGNGSVEEELGEACDDGAGDNGATTCGCQADCQFAATDVLCREGAVCDAPEMCDGAGACAVDMLAEDGSSCTSCESEPCECAAGVCVDIDLCGNGVVDATEEELCDDGVMNGAHDHCNQSCTARCDFDFAWVTPLGGPGGEEVWGLDIDQSGNAFAGGLFQTTSGGGSASFGSERFVSRSDSLDLWVTKVDPAGVVQWTGCAASSGDDNLEGLAVGPSGEVYIAGGYTGEAWFDCCGAPAAASCSNTLAPAGSEEDILVAKWSADGTFQWAFGGGSPFFERAYSVTADGYGNAIVVADTHARPGENAVLGDVSLPGNGTGQFVIFKLDPDGEVLWAKQAGGSGHEFSEGITVDGAGNIYFTGSSSSASFTWDGQLVSTSGTDDVIVVKLDPDGELIWAATAGGPREDAGTELTVDAMGQVFAVGIYNGRVEFGDLNVGSDDSLVEEQFVAKLDPEGNWVWVAGASRTTTAEGDESSSESVVVDRAGDLYVSGGFSGALSLGDHMLDSTPPGGDPAATNNAGYVAKLNGDGEFLWVKQIGGSGPSGARGIMLSPQGHLLVAGDYTAPATFDAIERVSDDLASPGETEAFIARLDPDDLADGCFECGDGTQDPGEACDEDDGRDHCAGTCDGTCSGPANICGDGWVQCGELSDELGVSEGEMCMLPPVPAIVGTWVAVDDPNDLLVIVFLEDGTYLHAEVDFDDGNEISGMERGEYTWSQSDGRVTVDQAGYTDNNGDTGLTELVAGSQAPFAYANVLDDELTITVDETGNGEIDGTVAFERAASAELVGTWLYMGSEPEFLLLIFFEDGTYLHAEVDPVGSPAIEGMEWGTYAIDVADGKLTATQTFDNNGGAGLTEFVSTTVAPFLFADVSGDSLVFTIDEDPNDPAVDEIELTRQP